MCLAHSLGSVLNGRTVQKWSDRWEECQAEQEASVELNTILKMFERARSRPLELEPRLETDASERSVFLLERVLGGTSLLNV